jgi:hypothetical protein
MMSGPGLIIDIVAASMEKLIVRISIIKYEEAIHPNVSVMEKIEIQH